MACRRLQMHGQSLSSRLDVPWMLLADRLHRFQTACRYKCVAAPFLVARLDVHPLSPVNPRT
jgi:hypothetical protein